MKSLTLNRPLMALVFIAVLAALLPACGSSGATVLRDTAWELESLTGNDVLPGTTITIEFSGDQVSGSAGCNQYGGSYQAGENSLSVGDVFSTEMGCLEPEGILEQEGVYLAALRAAAAYQITADRLEIFDEAGAQVLVFVAQ
jgi:heat shock protein HslJ